ncbi:hypothetical protein TYRP_014780 [Tyrophagus putrescentiae]|nr:hypothetical protein TYRP_014780 [Tyrophagus putrescentiae]
MESHYHLLTPATRNFSEKAGLVQLVKSDHLLFVLIGFVFVSAEQLMPRLQIRVFLRDPAAHAVVVLQVKCLYSRQRPPQLSPQLGHPLMSLATTCRELQVKVKRSN